MYASDSPSSEMPAQDSDKLLLKRPVTLKVIVTGRWKEEAQQQLQSQINDVDSQLQQLEEQGQRAINDLKKQSVDPPGPDVQQQIDNIQNQVNEKKSEMMQQRNQSLQQMEQIQRLELGQEVSQGQMDSFVRVGSGDNLANKMNVEILLRDGVIEEIRGEI